MARPKEAHIEAAKRMLAEEGANGGNVGEPAAAAGRVYDALFEALAPVIGAAGFRAIFARSVKLTTAKDPRLAELPGLTERLQGNESGARHVIVCLSKLEPAAASEAATGLYATLFGLMTNFIGEQLVMQIVKTAFPSVNEIRSKETE
jgi:hypothetical protein